MLLLSEVKKGGERQMGCRRWYCELLLYEALRLTFVDNAMTSCEMIFQPVVRLACSTLLFLSIYYFPSLKPST